MDAASVETFGRDLVTWVLQANGWALATLAVVFAIDRVLARHVSPGFRMALYVLVFARVFMAEGWSSPFGVLPVDAAVVDAAVAATGSPAASGQLPPGPNVVVAWELPRLSWGTGALLVHLLGTVFLVARLAAGRRELRRVRAVAAPTELGVHLRCRVVEHPSAGPLAMGVLDPVIVLPSSALDLPAEELAAVLRHEGAHVRHRDPIIQGVVGLGCALAWPVLAVWLAAARIRVLMEVRADAEATRPFDAVARRRYGEMLLRLASTGQLTPTAMGLGWAHLHTRLRALRRHRTASVSTQVFVVGVAATTCVALLAKREPAGDSPVVEDLMPTTVVLGGSADDCLVEYATSPEHALAVSAEDHFEAAECLLRAGDTERAAREMREAAWAAASTGDQEIAGAAASRLFALEVEMGNGELASRWATHAIAAYKGVRRNQAAQLEPSVDIRFDGNPEVWLGQIRWELTVKNNSSATIRDVVPSVSFTDGPTFLGTMIHEIGPGEARRSLVEGSLSEGDSSEHFTLGLAEAHR